LRAAILTRGNIGAFTVDQRAAFDAISAEVEIVVQAADASTTFTNDEVAGRRRQTVHAWAGEIDLNGLPPLWRTASVIHLAPIAQDFDPRLIGRIAPSYLGTTPQGWLRRWAENGGLVRHEPLRLPSELLNRLDALVISSDEYGQAREAYEIVGRRGLAVLTRGRQGASAIDRGRQLDAPGFPAKRVDTTGAGDVFAAALFLMRAEQEPLLASLRYASAAAALSIGGFGLDAIPARAQIEAFTADRQARP
jgi:sugar/nucleoside kinase (ribokinase family)